MFTLREICHARTVLQEAVYELTIAATRRHISNVETAAHLSEAIDQINEVAESLGYRLVEKETEAAQ